ncbi:hypothetical protein [Nostoc sp.]|uniref:hypothetical protein n=1 Tax=Nostoc sp. TaxID=1180 RepID=UPI002FF520D8
MSNHRLTVNEKKAKLMSDTAMVAIALPKKNGRLFSEKMISGFLFVYTLFLNTI